jgi:hypothetical protein
MGFLVEDPEETGTELLHDPFGGLSPDPFIGIGQVSDQSRLFRREAQRVEVDGLPRGDSYELQLLLTSPLAFPAAGPGLPGFFLLPLSSGFSGVTLRGIRVLPLAGPC